VLYLDSSVIVKLYFDERGSGPVRDRVKLENQIFTSELTFAEVHASLARKNREKHINTNEFGAVVRAFREDWMSKFVRIVVDSSTMTDIPELVRKYNLRGADAVHLAAALWLQEKTRISDSPASVEPKVEFCVADQYLASIASRCGLTVFNPETVS
jgi:predicted nucleic acid-binding protein